MSFLTFQKIFIVKFQFEMAVVNADFYLSGFQQTIFSTIQLKLMMTVF